MKSSSPLSAHCRSSNRRMVVPRAAMRSKKMRQAAKSSSRPPRRRRLEPQERQEGRFDPAPVVGFGDILGDRGRDARAGRGLVVALDEPGATPDHLAERPEGDAVAIGRRASAVPVDVEGDAVDVLLELPGEPALADAAGSGDRDQPRPAIPAGGVEGVLEEPELVLAADERRLGQVGTTVATALGDDAQRPPGGHRAGFALEQLLADGLEADGRRGRPLGRFADQDGPDGRHGLEPGSRVDQVSGDHPFTDRAEVDGGLAGQDAGPRLDAGASVVTASTRSMAARTARSASSSRAIGAPQTAITASPMNFSTVPP